MNDLPAEALEPFTRTLLKFWPELVRKSSPIQNQINHFKNAKIAQHFRVNRKNLRNQDSWLYSI